MQSGTDTAIGTEIGGSSPEAATSVERLVSRHKPFTRAIFNLLVANRNPLSQFRMTPKV